MATGALVLYYLIDWEGSRLRTLSWRWLLFAFYGWIAFKTVHSIEVQTSVYVVGSTLHNSLFLLPAAYEAFRTRSQLVAAVVCTLVMAFYTGLDGIWQYVTGYDFIKGDPHRGRLTGPMDTPRVGNLMAMLTPLFLALPTLLTSVRLRAGYTTRWGFTLVCMAPALFLLLFAQARAGWAAFFCGHAPLWPCGPSVMAFQKTPPAQGLADWRPAGITRCHTVQMLQKA